MSPSRLSSLLVPRLVSFRATGAAAAAVYRRRPAARFLQQRFLASMKQDDLVHYLADALPSVVRLEIEKHFEALNDKQKRYAHYISK